MNLVIYNYILKWIIIQNGFRFTPKQRGCGSSPQIFWPHSCTASLTASLLLWCDTLAATDRHHAHSGWPKAPASPHGSLLPLWSLQTLRSRSRWGSAVVASQRVGSLLQESCMLCLCTPLLPSPPAPATTNAFTACSFAFPSMSYICNISALTCSSAPKDTLISFQNILCLEGKPHVSTVWPPITLWWTMKWKYFSWGCVFPYFQENMNSWLTQLKNNKMCWVPMKFRTILIGWQHTHAGVTMFTLSF